VPPPPDLTDVEKALWDSFATGTAVDAGGGAVRADVLVALLREEAPGRAAAVHLRGGRVSGRLRLTFAEVTHPLLLEDCDFDEVPDLYWARMSHTSFAGSRMPGFLASNVRVDGHLQMSRCTVSDGVRLSGAQITGGLLVTDAVLGGSASEWALYARRASIGGDLVLAGTRLEGGLALTNARLGGTADLDRIRITAAPTERAMDADNLAVEAAFYCRHAEIQGEVTLRHARVAAALSFSRSAVRNPGGVAFRASRATLEGGLYLHDGFTAEGQVRVVSAQIVRTLRLDGASLRHPGEVALCADFVTIEGMLDGRRGLTVDGETSLLDATVSGPVHLEGAHLHNPGGAALTAHGMTCGGLLQLCEGFTADGRVRLAGAKVGSRVCFDRATVRAPGEIAVSCWRVETPELALRWARAPEGAVDLRYATVSILRDDPGTWPSTLDLDGLRYDVLEPSGEADTRLPWLGRGPDGFRPQPYEQLATVYQALGDGAQSRTVLLAKQRRQSAVGAWYARVWGVLQDVAVGYGYRPLRAASWLLALLVVGSVLYAGADLAEVTPGQATDFQPIVYTLDLLLPIVDLGQERAFQPAGARQWLAYLLIAAGWLLATTIAAGLTRSLRRG
jgi:hypothetical protein